MSKPTRSKAELAALVTAAIEAAIDGVAVKPPIIEKHIRDGMGRNWDVIVPAPTPLHRKAINSVRDQFDLS